MATRVNGSANSRRGPTPNGLIPPHESEDTVPTLVDSSEDPSFAVLSSVPASSSPSYADIHAFEKQYYPGQPISLSSIASHAFALGITLGISASLSIYLLAHSSLFWRPAFFVAVLGLFHFLEFWTTARYNTKEAKVASFLLSQNGSAYTIAHTAATIESLISCLCSTYFPVPNQLSLYLFPRWTTPLTPDWVTPLTITAGLLLIAAGQAVRSIAMVQAGSNFNHIVQARKATSHRLVTSGIYSVFRHPSYFGFFWWGLGTQLVLGNVVCLAGYAAVLWLFFKRRIAGS